jgi:hypothetical protein
MSKLRACSRPLGTLLFCVWLATAQGFLSCRFPTLYLPLKTHSNSFQNSISSLGKSSLSKPIVQKILFFRCSADSVNTVSQDPDKSKRRNYSRETSSFQGSRNFRQQPRENSVNQTTHASLPNFMGSYTSLYRLIEDLQHVAGRLRSKDSATAMNHVARLMRTKRSTSRRDGSEVQHAQTSTVMQKLARTGQFRLCRYQMRKQLALSNMMHDCAYASILWPLVTRDSYLMHFFVSP